MDQADNRVEILTTARSLLARDRDGFTVASVCRETGLNRSKIRRHFPTKNALIAYLENEAAQKPKYESPPAMVASEDDGDDQPPHADAQVSVLLAAKTEEAASVEAPSVVAIEEAPPSPETVATTPPLDLPPIVAEPVAQLPSEAVFDAADLPPPVFDTPSHQPFQVRARVQQILANAQQPENNAPAGKRFDWMPDGPRLMAAAALIVAVLMAGTGLVSLGGLARAKQTPAAPATQLAEVPHAVLVIDATGAAPDPMYQEVPPTLRETIVRARRGETKAQVELAQSFLRGQGVNADPVAAARWSDEAAAQGDATAQFIMGSLYAEGIKPNPRLAFDWFSAAASRGNVKAMHNLAIAYLNGSGVDKDAKLAAAWFAKAANAGYRDSAFDLAVLFERGEGVMQNGQEALRWYDHAAALGDPEARQRAGYLRSQSWQIAGQQADQPPS